MQCTLNDYVNPAVSNIYVTRDTCLFNASQKSDTSTFSLNDAYLNNHVTIALGYDDKTSEKLQNVFCSKQNQRTMTKYRCINAIHYQLRCISASVILGPETTLLWLHKRDTRGDKLKQSTRSERSFSRHR